MKTTKQKREASRIAQHKYLLKRRAEGWRHVGFILPPQLIKKLREYKKKIFWEWKDQEKQLIIEWNKQRNNTL
jgi:hypothetical protein